MIEFTMFISFIERTFTWIRDKIWDKMLHQRKVKEINKLIAWELGDIHPQLNVLPHYEPWTMVRIDPDIMWYEYFGGFIHNGMLDQIIKDYPNLDISSDITFYVKKLAHAFEIRDADDLLYALSGLSRCEFDKISIDQINSNRKWWKDIIRANMDYKLMWD